MSPGEAIRFASIRQWDGTQARAFEELCFQLRDPAPDGVAVTKTGDPDAGVEWYWTLPDGTEWGWQVKFMTDTDPLIQKMRESLKSVVERRPQVRKLTFCIPIDLPDDPSRAGGRTQARQKFRDARERWLEFAPAVETAVLSAGDLLERLAREEHRGRETFFFHKRLLGQSWCRRELDGTIEDAGDRYTPTQNVDLPVDRVLEAVGLAASFRGSLTERTERALRQGRSLVIERAGEATWRDELAAVRDALIELENLDPFGHPEPTFDPAAMQSAVEDALAQLDHLMSVLRPIAWETEDGRETSSSDADALVAREQERISMEARAKWQKGRDLEDCLAQLHSFLAGDASRAAHNQALFVIGEAGRGKTHLVCDVAERLHEQGHPVVAILGQRFGAGSPWTTLARVLDNDALGPDDIVGILSASGEAANCRAVLLIDALNESKDPSDWARELADIRRRVTATPWVGLVVTCRSTYLDLVTPPTGRDMNFAWVEHRGYKGREFDAIEKIFLFHELDPPRIPLLIPEFANPLFLKLYCEGLKDNRGDQTNTRHLSAVFERFAASRSERVRRRLRLDPNVDTVHVAISSFARELGRRGVDRLAYVEAQQLLSAFEPHLQGSPNTLIEAMTSEGLLSVERGWIPDAEAPATVVSFPYQRFSDHLVVEALLDDRLPTASSAEVGDAFRPENDLGAWVSDAPRGLVEALAARLPERWNVELLDLVETPSEDDWTSVHRYGELIEAFLGSLIMRDRSAFTERTTDLLNEALPDRPDSVAELLVNVAPDPDHPYNGDCLHRYLSPMPMADRDAFWTWLVYDGFGNESHPLDRLTRWSASGAHRRYSDEIIELTAIPLIWQLASPNRPTRDYTTKALATLFIDRFAALTESLERFASCNDPYVKQRLTAVALGAVTRSSPDGLTAKSARRILDMMLRSYISEPAAVPDVLARDYVASLARWLHRHQLIGPTRLRKASPPYNSKTPATPRSEKYLREHYPPSHDYQGGYSSLEFSALSSHSDWARYVVEGPTRRFRPIAPGEAESPPAAVPEAEARVDETAWRRFVKSLRDEQVALLSPREGDLDRDALLKSLADDQLTLLRGVRKPPRRRRARAIPERLAMPTERAARYIFQRAVGLGWTPELFADVDRQIARRGEARAANKPERFGKKYQWIAFHELIARLADNFVVEDHAGPERYAGAWQLHLRDIDPTIPPEAITIGADGEHDRTPTFGSAAASGTWWRKTSPVFDCPTEAQQAAWAGRQSDLPTPDELLRVTDAHGGRWVVVDGYHTWREGWDEPASVTAGDGVRREFAALSLGTFIRKEDLASLTGWLGTNRDLLRALPDWGSQGIWQSFWSELPDESAAFGYPVGWREHDGWSKLPVTSAAAGLRYAGGGSDADCSLSDSVNASLPSLFMRDRLAARWVDAERAWCDSSGRRCAQYLEHDETHFRGHVLLVAEAALTQSLTPESGLVLAIGVFCERRAFRRPDGTTLETLGWTDFAGYLIFDGESWDSDALEPIHHHHATPGTTDGQA